jgi:hypothetical protein
MSVIYPGFLFFSTPSPLLSSCKTALCNNTFITTHNSNSHPFINKSKTSAPKASLRSLCWIFFLTSSPIYTVII